MGPVGVALGSATALGIWWLFRDPPRHYYYAKIDLPSGVPLFLFPPSGYVPITDSQATNWRIDLMEGYWGGQVTLYRWEPDRGGWRVA